MTRKVVKASLGPIMSLKKDASGRRSVQVEVEVPGTPEEAFGLIKTSDPDRMRIVQSGLDKEDLLATA